MEYFRQLSERRKIAHSSHLDRITAHAFYHYHAPPHPSQLAEAQTALKRGIDEDWQASVQRYPEVLEYFYGLVELTLPANDEPAVKEPPLGTLTGHRKAQRRGEARPSSGAYPGTVATVGFHEANIRTPRTPPPPSRRTPAPRDRRSGSYRPATAHIDRSPYHAPF